MTTPEQMHRDAPPAGTGGVRARTPGAHWLIGLQRQAGNAAVTKLLLQRHPVAGTPVHRHTATDLFGAPGTTLEEFQQSLTVQADWFAEPTLSATDRDDLHALLARTHEGPHILAGVGDVLLTELRGVAAANWTALSEYGRGRRNAGETVRLIDSAASPPLADRIAMGNTLIALKAVFTPTQLAASVSETQFHDVHTAGLVPALSAYVTVWQPNLEMTYEPGPAARDFEFENMLTLLKGTGTGPFAPLLGKVRDLHRFSAASLMILVANFADHSRARPVHLLLHGSRDAAGAFQESAGLFASMIGDGRFNTLMLEGRDSIADLTAAVPGLAADYGKPDATGTPRIAQVMIAGHGEAQQVDLAQNDDMNISGDPANAAQKRKTEELLNTLMANMDPVTARVVYAGCLVGSPTPGGGQNLVGATEDAARAHGIAAGRTQGARASVALAASSSLTDAAGNLAIQYGFDPAAYGGALIYVATGHEPTGLFRSAVELATTDPVVAANQLRARQTMGVTAGHEWFDDVIVAAIRVALVGVPAGGPVPLATLQMLEGMVDPIFLVGNSEDGHGRTVGTLIGAVNSQPLAGALYAEVAKQGPFNAPGDASMRNGRFVIDQGWLALGGPRSGPILGWLDATPTATVGWIGVRLDTGAIAAASPLLFPAAAPVTVGRIRLALAWLRADPTNPDVKNFLTDQVVRAAGVPPALSPAVTAELDGGSADEVLTALRVIASVPSATGGPSLPAANAQVRAGHQNEVRVEPNPYVATVIAGALNVRSLPGMHGSVFEVVRAGDQLQVAGFTHDWAAVDRNGRLGFVFRKFVTPP